MAADTGRIQLEPGDRVRFLEIYPAQGLRGVVVAVVKVAGRVVTVEIVSGVRLVCMDYHLEKAAPPPGR